MNGIKNLNDLKKIYEGCKIKVEGQDIYISKKRGKIKNMRTKESYKDITKEMYERCKQTKFTDGGEYCEESGEYCQKCPLGSVHNIEGKICGTIDNLEIEMKNFLKMFEGDFKEKEIIKQDAPKSDFSSLEELVISMSANPFLSILGVEPNETDYESKYNEAIKERDRYKRIYKISLEIIKELESVIEDMSK